MKAISDADKNPSYDMLKSGTVHFVQANNHKGSYEHLCLLVKGHDVLDLSVMSVAKKLFLF